jgi:hypothetical protein
MNYERVFCTGSDKLEPFWLGIQKLAERVDASWEIRHFERESFPEIAREELVHANLAAHFSENDLLTALWACGDLPRQLDPEGQFGQPPITVLRTPRFLVDLYLWNKVDISIHDHTFVGAFGNLSGDSINCVYEFATADDSDPNVRTGALNRKTFERLRPGDVRAIEEGRRFIHQVWHLTQPTITIALRTWDYRPEVNPFLYLDPGLTWRYKPGLLTESEQRRIQLARYLFSRCHPRRIALTEALILSSGPFAGLSTLFGCSDACHSDDWLDLSRTLESSDLFWLRAGLAAIKAYEYRSAVSWNNLIDYEQREVIAALSTCRNRTELRGFPIRASLDDLVDTVVRMSSKGVLSFQLEPGHMTLIKQMAAGKKSDHLLTAVLREHPDLAVDSESMQEVCASLRALPLLQPLWVD